MKTEMDAELLHLIETRVERLKNFLGLNTNNIESSDNISESLLSANNLIHSTLNEHQHIAKASDQHKEIQNYLDANYLDKSDDAKAKEIFVKSIASMLVTNFEMTKKVTQMESTLGAEYIRNFPEISDFLKKTNEQLQKSKQSNEILEESLILAMQRYSIMQKSVTNFLKKVNENLTEYEEKSQITKNYDNPI